jgi:imidazolonepropionase-like amidohydrolase
MKTNLLAASVAVLLTTSVSAATTAIVGGIVAIGDGSEPITNGTVLFRDGRIVAAGANVPLPGDATVVDAHGKWVTAGIIAGFSTLGIAGNSYVHQLNDAAAPKSPYSAAVDIASAVNPADDTIQTDRAAGITRAIVAPSASTSIFAGQGAVIALGVGMNPITRPRAFQYVELGERGAQLAGGSRPAAYALFRDAMAQAQHGRVVPATQGGNDRERLTQFDTAALIPVVNGQQLLVVHVERASDILQVLALKREFPALRIVLLGASEGWMVAPQIAAAQVPVISEAIKDLPFAFEALAATESNVGRMTRAGVSVGISTMDALPLERNLKQLAANLVAITKIPGATGLPWGQAFATITSKPAQAVGMDSELGSLRQGRRADVVIWDGDPLEIASAPVAMFIDGVPQPLDNHLTKLRERYREQEKESLPKAYRR